MKKLQTKKSIALFVLCPVLIFLFSHACTTIPVTSDPTDEWPVSPPETQGMQSKILADMMADIEDSSYHLDNVLIVRNGRIVLDAYFWPFSKGKKHNMHGSTTSIISALIGIAIDKGYLDGVHQPVTDFFPDQTIAHLDDRKRSMTLEHLLTMTAGLDCRDSYRYHWAGLREMRKSRDWAQFTLDLPMAHAPGETFEYCNGVSHLLSAIIRKATGMETIDFARKHLFSPMGITDIGWAQSPRGVDIGWGEMRLSPHDMAKFGWLFLQKGRWENRRIVPEEWVTASTKMHVDAAPFGHYGYQWWIDSEGHYGAVGYKGQRIFVVPEKHLVAVFTGNLTGEDSLLPQKLLNLYILPAASADRAPASDDKEQARLAALVKRASEEPQAGYAWTSEPEGMAKDGMFTRAASPAFQFQYPLGSRKSALKYPGQVMHMKTLGDVPFSAFVVTPLTGMALKDFGPEIYTRELKRVGSDITISSNERITLKCGTEAYRTNIRWLYRNRHPVDTLLVSAFREGKLVFVNAHPTPDQTFNVNHIVESLSFK